MTFDNECYPGMAIHEMGTARMGNDPKDSVLNKWNQMHELVTCLLQMVLACHPCQTKPKLLWL
jgi:hypothetical protein